MSKKGQKRIISLLNFWHAAKKAVLFILFFEGSLTIFSLSLSQRCKNAQNKINFPTNEEPHHNEQTTTRKTRDGENDDAFISSGAKSSSSSSVFFP